MNSEIEKNQWDQYLKDFSKRNELRPARIEVVGEEIGAQEGGQHLPLAGISFESKGSEAGDVVMTFTGQTSADARHLSHRINSASRIFPRTGADGREDGLEIDSGDGIKTILVFEQLPQLEPATS